MSYQDRLASALNLIAEYNKSLPDQKICISEQKFSDALKYFGAISESDLTELTWEQVLVCLEDGILDKSQKQSYVIISSVRPIKLAQKISRVFRNKSNAYKDSNTQTTQTTENVVYISTKKADRMTIRELIEHLDITNIDNSVGKKLKEISNNQPFIVYKPHSNLIDIEATTKCLEEIKLGYPPRQFYVIDREPHKIYKLTEKQDFLVDENPLYKDIPLRPDETCDQTNRSWAGIEKSVRQFLRLGIENKEIQIKSIEDAHRILDSIIHETSEREQLLFLKGRYPKTCIEFDEKDRIGDLPKLRISLKHSYENRGKYQELCYDKNGVKVVWNYFTN